MGLRTRQSEKATDVAEQHCPACGGTGFPTVRQPAQPGRRVFPMPCKKCGGKGRIAKAKIHETYRHRTSK
jgi:DnaJ-class molecular chaperone